MLEWLPDKRRGFVPYVDQFISPTKYCHKRCLVERLPSVWYNWPTDYNRYFTREVTKCERFLFINGSGGYNGRKGLDVIQRLLRLVPDLPLLVRTNVATGQKLPHNPNVEVAPGTSDNAGLYSSGDVLIYPAHLDGYGLQPIEAMCSGLPVIVPEGKPWDENYASRRIPTTKRKVQIKRKMYWYDMDVMKLAKVCTDMLDEDLTQASKDSAKWARTWEWNDVKAKALTELIEG
jgi:hypothetical protein